MRIEVLRAFYWEGRARQVGEVIELTDRQARELSAMGKARSAPDAPPQPNPGPMTTESAAELVPGGRKRKEKDDAL